MSNQEANLALLFTSQLQEIQLDDLFVRGELPFWLKGSFISNGPAQFEIAEQAFNHWFDGFAMLKKFCFLDGKVSFTNRFLHSCQYRETRQKQHLYFNEFATYANHSVVGRLWHGAQDLISGVRYDNCNVNITYLPPYYLAMTETSHQVAFDSESLQTLGEFHFQDQLKGQLTLAHPQLDMTTGEMINITTNIGRHIEYHIYSVAANSIARKLIKSYVCNTLFYMHSFSITANYIILYKTPLQLNKYKLLFGVPFKNALYWDDSASSALIVINKNDGTVKEITTDDFVCLHGANAYEHQDEIILDLVCYGKGDPYDMFYLKALRSPVRELTGGKLKRFIINLHSGQSRFEFLSDTPLEFPRINYRGYNGKSYQYLYTVAMQKANQPFFTIIQKNQMTTGKTWQWQQDGYYVGEAIFVAKPQGKTEDEGIVLSLAYNSHRQHTALIILDARDMRQRAEVALPIHFPMGLHGNFYF